MLLETRIKRMAQHLKQRGFCVVFDRDLERCWPSSRMSSARRERKSKKYAESQGCNAAILDAGFGMKAILQKPEFGIGAASI